MSSEGESESIGAGKEGKGMDPPTSAVAMVNFRRRNQSSSVLSPEHQQSLKFETDQASTESTNPLNMWQVYALGGFMVMQWIWARRRKRNVSGEQD